MSYTFWAVLVGVSLPLPLLWQCGACCRRLARRQPAPDVTVEAGQSPELMPVNSTQASGSFREGSAASGSDGNWVGRTCPTCQAGRASIF